MEIEFIKTAFITLLVAIDPPGLVPIFLALTSGMTLKDRKITARQSSIIALCVLSAAAVVGEPLLSAIGISMPAFRIAGGLLLFYIAFEMVFDRREQRKSDSAETAIAHDPRNIAAFPLAIPLMAGPGAITATILQAGNAQGNFANMAALIAIIFVVIGLCWLSFRLANQLDRLLGFTGRIVLERLLGVLLAALAVQIIGDGVLAFFRPV
jgi:multiple antibiotic resistance protein